MNKYIVLLALATCSIGVSLSGINTIHFVFLITGGFLGSALALLGPKDNNLNSFLLFYLSPFVLSLFISLPVNYLFFNDKFHYYELDIVGRVVMLTATVFTIMSIHSFTLNKRMSFNTVLKTYYFSCIVMVLSAIWQALDFHTSFPVSFPFETRTNVHGSQNVSLDKRLTGLAEEPSYLAPFLNEFLIFTVLLVKNKMLKWGAVSLGIILIFLTFSPSSYTSFLILAAIFVFYKVNKVFFAFIVSAIILIVPFFTFGDIEALTYYNDRILGVEGSGRFRIIADSLSLFFNDTNFFSLLFGNGFKTFQIMSTAPEISYYRITSNNLFVDVVFECGIIGVILLIAFLVYLFKLASRVKDRDLKLMSLLLYFNLFLSSFYRADFTTLKFFIIIYIIFYVSNYYKTIKI